MFFCNLNQGSPCLLPGDKLASLEEQTKARKATESEAARIRRLKQEYLSTALVKKISKPCPSCGMDIEKFEGWVS